MKFINRQREMRRLNRLVNLPEGGLAVVWGRRRIGKTRLLLEWAHAHKGIYFTADESAAPLQRKYFALAIEQVLSGFSKVEYPDWASLLSRLAQDAEHANWRGPIVIDELPYLIATSPELPSLLQKFIDRDAKKAKLIVALCGSSQRMMQGACLEPSSPLYGRAQELIKLEPILPGYMQEALGLKTPTAVIEYYAVWGGIPRYWELIHNSQEEFLDAIDSIVLDSMGQLYDEPNRLLLEENPSAIALRPILDAIGLGCHRLSEISGRIGQPATALTRPLQRLLELDLIQREVPYGTAEHHSKRTLYKIKDPFMRFWFEVVASRRSSLAQLPPALRKSQMQKFLPSLFENMWEELCRQAIPKLSLPETFGPSGRFWHGNGPEWDILSQSQEMILIGEAKWSVKSLSQKWINNAVDAVKAKGIPPVWPHNKKEVLFVLFVPQKTSRIVPSEDVRVVDAEEVLAALS